MNASMRIVALLATATQVLGRRIVRRGSSSQGRCDPVKQLSQNRNAHRTPGSRPAGVVIGDERGAQAFSAAACFALAEGAARLPVSAESGHLEESAQVATKGKSWACRRCRSTEDRARSCRLEAVSHRHTVARHTLRCAGQIGSVGLSEIERRAGLERLFEQHYAAVLAYALRRAPRAVAEDVVSEAFVVVSRRIEDVPVDALPWLYGVARRVLANERRGEVRRDWLTQELGLNAVPVCADTAHSDVGRILAVLAQLPEPDREALMLTAWEGLSSAEAAAAAGLQPGRDACPAVAGTAATGPPAGGR
jgi:RNA polymerase sigma-70 factor (ECF subfamily)